MMVTISSKRLETAKASVADAKPQYDSAVKIAGEADAMMAKPAIRQLVVNTALAKAMIGSNRLYPDLYDFVKPYIPGFFRITNLSASPIDGKSCTVNMTGTIKNAQQYADLMLALLRIPGAVSVTRGGFQSEDIVVPAITVGDQKAKPRLESKAPIPDDPLERLVYFQNGVAPTGFQNSGNFGNTEFGTEKGVRPGESLISVSVTIPRNIQTPNPRATIQSLAGGGGATPAPASSPGTPPGRSPVGS